MFLIVVIFLTLCVIIAVKIVTPSEIQFDIVSIAISAGISVAILLGGVLITIVLSRMYYLIAIEVARGLISV